MQPQHIATLGSADAALAAFAPQSGMIAPGRYWKSCKSAMMRGCAPVGARISYERQDAENSPLMSEQNDRSKQCQRHLKPFVPSASWPLYQPAAAARHLTTPMSSLIRRPSRLSHPTPASTNKSFRGRALRPAFAPTAFFDEPSQKEEASC